jgi:hypothetical protein
MKRFALAMLTFALVVGAADFAQAEGRHSRRRNSNGITIQIGGLGYGGARYSNLPSYGYRDSYYGNYGGNCHDSDYGRLQYYHQRSRAFAYPRYDYGYGGGGAFDGSRHGGNSWYWRSQQAGNGNVAWGQLYNEMYGGR